MELFCIIVSMIVVAILVWGAQYVHDTRVEMGELDEQGNEIFPPKEFVCCADCKKLKYEVENDEVICTCENSKRKMRGLEEISHCYCMEGEKIENDEKETECKSQMGN